MKIKFFSLLNLSQHGAVCSIIKLDKYRIMLDCGISERYDYSVYQKYQKKIKKVNIILLSHAEIQYHGALPYLFFELGCQAEVYSTLPVSDLSLVNMFDFVLNRCHNKLPTEDKFYEKLYKNIADLYDKINKIKFRQHIFLTVPDKEVSIKPYHIGHTVGACAWCISTERRNILYLVTYNHSDERILNGMDFSHFDEKNIDLLITNSNNIRLEYKKVKDRETDLRNYIEYAAKNHGNVILACASTSRMYEVLLFTLKLWQAKAPWDGPVHFYHNFMGLFHLAHSQLEFMSDSMTDEFYSNGDNPFRHFIEQNRHEEKLYNADVKLCRSPADVNLSTPGKLIITNMSNLFFGSASELLGACWNNSKDLLVLTERRDFYEGYMEHLQNKENYFAPDLVDKNFFMNIVHKEKKDKVTTDNTDAGSTIADQETVITEEEYQPINKPAIQNTLFSTKNFPGFSFIQTKAEGNDYGEFMPESLLENLRKHTAKIDTFSRDNNVNAPTGVVQFKAKFEPYFFEDGVIVFPRGHSTFQNTPPKLRVVDIDLNGLSDGDSMIRIINSLNPNYVLFLNGTPEDNALIKSKLLNTRSEESLCFATLEQNSEIELISNSLDIKVNPELFDNINFNTIAANNLEFSMGRVRGFDALIKSFKNLKVDCELVPSGSLSNFEETEKNFEAYGYVDLEKFRKVLEEYNFTTYYKEGILCVNNIFFVKKTNKTVVIEGRFCKEYIEIRNLLYSFIRL